MAEKIKKIYHGPSNIGGIGGYISKYLRRRGYISECILYDDKSVRDNYDYNLHLSSYCRINRYNIRLFHFLLMLFKYNVFHFNYGTTLLPFGIDLPILKLFRKKVVMSYCGSDIRLYNKVEKKRNPYIEIIKKENIIENEYIKIIMLYWQGFWCDKIIAIRSNYENATYIINKQKVLSFPWINNLGLYHLEKEVIQPMNKRPIIIHAPTNSNIKGTKYIEKAISSLQEKGLDFDYKRVENMPNKVVQKMYMNADIIIDQLLLGSFGTLAVEGMAYGKPVICYIIDEIKERHYPDCPIYNANIDNIEKRLETLILNKELRLKLGAMGESFVKKHFNNEKILSEMEKIYEEL